MTEISYITQNGEQINLKDAKGRELLETKQPKLKAGNGISIAADGTISATGASGTEKAYAVFSKYEDNDEYDFLNIVNPTYFKKGKRYKASISYFGSFGFNSEAVKLRISPRLEQGSLGFKGYDSEAKTLEQYVSEAVANGGGGAAEVSGWSPSPIYLGTTENDGYYYYTDINIEDLPEPDNTGKKVINLAEFEYTFNDFGQFISDENNEQAEGNGGAGVSGYVASCPCMFLHFEQINKDGNTIDWSGSYELPLGYNSIIVTFEEV